MKWGHYTLIMCIVILSLVFPFSVSSSADDVLIPACPLYPTTAQLPFGSDTVVVYASGTSSDGETYTHYPEWFFISKSGYVDSNNSNIWSAYGSLTISGNTSIVKLNFASYSRIIRYYYNTGLNKYVRQVVGTYDNTLLVYALTDFQVYGSIYSTEDQTILGYNIGLASQYGISVPSSSPEWTVCGYASDFSAGLASLSNLVADQSELIDLYYQSISEQISELQSLYSLQGSRFESALQTAQSEIQSHADEAASSAADDIINAGEDISDLNTDVEDVTDIVDKLNEWVSDLDDFADHIDEAATGVASAMDAGTAMFDGFLSICPPIVIALFAFAIVFLVVRKIIGR